MGQWTVLVAAVLAASVAAACSPSASAPAPTSAPPPAGAAKGEASSALSAQSTGRAVAPSADTAQRSAGAPGAPPQAPAAVPAPAVGAPAGSTAPAPDASGSSATLLDRMVIRNAKLSLQVEDMERTLAQVADIARAGGGFISASNTRTERVNTQDRPLADLTLQVRSEALDQTLVSLRRLAVKIESETTTSQDVTEEYVDLEANLRNLQASEGAIQRLLDRAQRIEDVITLQRELTNIRGQIERIQGRKTFLERRTDMATVTLALRLPPIEATTAAGPGWDPVAVAKRAWDASLLSLAAIASVVIVVAAYSWWMLPLVALGVWGVRRARRPRPMGAATA